MYPKNSRAGALGWSQERGQVWGLGAGLAMGLERDRVWAEPGTSLSQSSLWTYLSRHPLPPHLGDIRLSLALLSHHFCF